MGVDLRGMEYAREDILEDEGTAEGVIGGLLR